MINGTREENSSRKGEGNANEAKIAPKASTSSSSASWLRLKDPRIVRVSRAFGGKDRHSKVCTIRGLRDRRVRLSVPTAIHLYDLQDRLGLNQPSKVVDWLLNAAKLEIDELPPLPMTPNFSALNHHQAMLNSSLQFGGASNSSREGFKLNNVEDPDTMSRANFWSSEALFMAESKEVENESMNQKDKEDSNGDDGAQVSSTTNFPKNTHSSSERVLNNAMPYGSFFHLESPNFALQQFGSHGLITTQTEDLPSLNVIPLHSTLSLSSGSQILASPPTAQPYFPSSNTSATSLEIDSRQVNHFQMLPTSFTASSLCPKNQSIKPFHLSVNPSLHYSENNGSHQLDKDQEFPPKG